MLKDMGPEAALVELRKRLEDGLTRIRLDKTQLAGRTGLSRSTVQAAFQRGGRAPSAATVKALAEALRLPLDELLALQRTAVGKSEPAPTPGPGKPIAAWDPHDLEVHPAGASPQAGTESQRMLPGYVRRAHDQELTNAAEKARSGRSQMLVLVGSSSTGKTRACWEAVRPLAADGWQLWHPFDPTRAEAALADLGRVKAHTVVWLNETQHYLQPPETGERIAAALHTLLSDPDRAPVLVLATLWPEYANQYMRSPQPQEPDPHSQARELLTGRTITVPETFDQHALRAAEALAHGGDLMLANSLSRARTDGRVAQDLAGAPELLRRYEQGSPAVRALLEVAMDARRLGIGLHLPEAFLTDAAADYFADYDWDQLPDDWAASAYADLAHPTHGKQALRRTKRRPEYNSPTSDPVLDVASVPSEGTVFRLADYLEQHGRITRTWKCPPRSFWAAAHTHLAPDDLNNLAQAADNRHRLRWAHDLRCRAAEAGSASAMVHLAGKRGYNKDWVGAEALYLRAVDAGSTDAMIGLAGLYDTFGRQENAVALYRRAADAGSTFALGRLAKIREEVEDPEGAEALYLEAVDAGSIHYLESVAELREAAGDRKAADEFLRKLADAGDGRALESYARRRWLSGDRDGAEVLYRWAFEAGSPFALDDLLHAQEEAGDKEGVEALLRWAVGINESGYAQVHLARMREEAEDWDEALYLYLKAARAGESSSLDYLVQILEGDGDWEPAEELIRSVIDSGHSHASLVLARLRGRMGDREGMESLLLQIAETAKTDTLKNEGIWAFNHSVFDPGAQALKRLVQIRENSGDQEGAEIFAHRVADAGNTHCLVDLAKSRAAAGNEESAELIYLRAADAGQTLDLFKEKWPQGLDPDGSPTLPWL